MHGMDIPKQKFDSIRIFGTLQYDKNPKIIKHIKDVKNIDFV